MTDKNTGWQSIRSAPRDGTVIDLWCDDERLTNCFWKDYPYWKWWQQYAESPGNNFPVDGKADYWMPLPKPPELLPDRDQKERKDQADG